MTGRYLSDVQHLQNKNCYYHPYPQGRKVSKRVMAINFIEGTSRSVQKAYMTYILTLAELKDYVPTVLAGNTPLPVHSRYNGKPQNLLQGVNQLRKNCLW